MRIEQEKIWKLRVAELENAITEAKRCKRVKEALNPVVTRFELRYRESCREMDLVRAQRIPSWIFTKCVISDHSRQVDFRDLARASQTGDRGRSHFPDWKPARGKKIPGFFRPPQTTG